MYCISEKEKKKLSIKGIMNSPEDKIFVSLTLNKCLDGVSKVKCKTEAEIEEIMNINSVFVFFRHRKFVEHEY